MGEEGSLMYVYTLTLKQSFVYKIIALGAILGKKSFKLLYLLPKKLDTNKQESDKIFILRKDNMDLTDIV